MFLWGTFKVYSMPLMNTDIPRERMTFCITLDCSPWCCRVLNSHFAICCGLLAYQAVWPCVSPIIRKVCWRDKYVSLCKFIYWKTLCQFISLFVCFYERWEWTMDWLGFISIILNQAPTLLPKLAWCLPWNFSCFQFVRLLPQHPKE